MCVCFSSYTRPPADYIVSVLCEENREMRSAFLVRKVYTFILFSSSRLRATTPKKPKHFVVQTHIWRGTCDRRKSAETLCICSLDFIFCIGNVYETDRHTFGWTRWTLCVDERRKERDFGLQHKKEFENACRTKNRNVQWREMLNDLETRHFSVHSSRLEKALFCPSSSRVAV